MDLVVEFLFWVRVWVIEIGILLGVIIWRCTENMPKRPLNKTSIGLMIVIVGTVIYLQSDTGLFLIDNWSERCKSMEDDVKQYLNCFSKNQQDARQTIFLYGFFATIAILLGNILVAMPAKKPTD